jgi:hypothetical protein
VLAQIDELAFSFFKHHVELLLLLAHHLYASAHQSALSETERSHCEWGNLLLAAGADVGALVSADFKSPESLSDPANLMIEGVAVLI